MFFHLRLICCLFLVPFSLSEIVNIEKTLAQLFSENEIQKEILKAEPNLTSDVVLSMFDASTKNIPSGIAKGNFFELGNFDECYDIESNGIYGKYCLGTLSFDLFNFDINKVLGINFTKQPALQLTPQPRLIELPNHIGFHFARCVPHTTQAKDIIGISTFTEDLCYSKATIPDYSAGAIITIVILSLFGLIVVLSTSFDIYCQFIDKDPPHELLIAFSFLTNGRKILKSSKNPDQLLCLNGIKAISMMWVVIGHEYSLMTNAPLSNFIDLFKWSRDSANMFIIGATVSVDTFFVVGGLVTVYSYLKSVDKKVKFNLFLFYFHRYLRLTPAFAIMCLVTIFLFPYIGNGPLWAVVDYTLVQPCKRGWWSSLIYMNNYHQVGECLPQSWYLNVDMQLYLLSPIVLIPLAKWPKYTLAFMSFLVFAGCAVPFGVSYGENLSVWMGSNGDFAKMIVDLYKQTYARFGPYVIGMLAGYYIYKLKKNEWNLRLSKLVVAILWLVCLTGLVACVYSAYPLMTATEEDKWGNAFFNGFSRSAWAVCVAVIIILCVSGYGKPVDVFLSWSVFQFITKLSYSIYLVHYGMIILKYASMRNVVQFSDLEWFHIFWADFALFIAVSFVLCLTFESPIIIIEKYLFGRGTSPKQVERSKEKPQV